MNYEITSGVLNKPYKIVIYGPEGIGKSTFAAHFPDPLFIDTEGSTARMDVKRLKKPDDWNDLLTMIDWVIYNKPCKTLVIDTMDWAERMEVEHLCKVNGKSSIEDFGYGKGYVFSADEIGRFLDKLSGVVDAGMNVILTAHSKLEKFEQPDEAGSYDRYTLKLGKQTGSKTSALCKEWADMVLFANYKTILIEDSRTKKLKAHGGHRVMYTTHNPCWDAKNRDNLPDECEFDFKAIAHLFGEQKKAQPQESNEPTWTSWTDQESVDDQPKQQTMWQSAQKTPEAAKSKVEKPKKAEQPKTMPVPEASTMPYDMSPKTDGSEKTNYPNGINYNLPIYKNMNQKLAKELKKSGFGEEDLRKTFEQKQIAPYDMQLDQFPDEWIESEVLKNWNEFLDAMTENNMPF